MKTRGEKLQSLKILLNWSENMYESPYYWKDENTIHDGNPRSISVINDGFHNEYFLRINDYFEALNSCIDYF